MQRRILRTVQRRILRTVQSGSCKSFTAGGDCLDKDLEVLGSQKRLETKGFFTALVVIIGYVTLW